MIFNPIFIPVEYNLNETRLSNIVLVLFIGISGVSSAEAQGTRIDFSTIPKSGTILINAHMDDDLIWMLPFLENIREIYWWCNAGHSNLQDHCQPTTEFYE